MSLKRACCGWFVFPVPIQTHFLSKLYLPFPPIWFSTGPWLKSALAILLFSNFSVQWTFIRAVNEMDKILVQFQDVPVENSSENGVQHFLHSNPGCHLFPPAPSASATLTSGLPGWTMPYSLRLQRLLPLSLSPVSTCMHYLLILFKSQRMNSHTT